MAALTLAPARLWGAKDLLCPRPQPPRPKGNPHRSPSYNTQLHGTEHAACPYYVMSSCADSISQGLGLIYPF